MSEASYFPAKEETAAAPNCFKEAVCIHTDKVYDSCRDKDCLENIRVYLTACGQDVIDRATSIRCRGTEVINVISEVERVPFNRGFYSIDITFFFSVCLDVISSPNCPAETVNGLAVFSKKCILYGSDGNVKIFTSEFAENEKDEQLPVVSGSPRAKIQVAEPICLDAKLCRPCDCCNNTNDRTDCDCCLHTGCTGFTGQHTGKDGQQCIHHISYFAV